MTDKKKQRNTADLLVECLEEEGVHIFSVSPVKKIWRS